MLCCKQKATIYRKSLSYINAYKMQSLLSTFKILFTLQVVRKTLTGKHKHSFRSADNYVTLYCWPFYCIVYRQYSTVQRKLLFIFYCVYVHHSEGNRFLHILLRIVFSLVNRTHYLLRGSWRLSNNETTNQLVLTILTIVQLHWVSTVEMLTLLSIINRVTN